MLNKLTKNLIPLAIIVAGLAVGGALIFTGQGGETDGGKTGFLSPQEAAEKAIKFINENMLTAENQASLIDVFEEGSIYKIKIEVGSQEYDSFVSKDGRFLFPEGIDLKEVEESEDSSSASGEVPKSDKPDVKIFVMSYCPYGLQAQKMFLPVYNLLKDKADMGVYFVNYIMHGKEEIDENLRQYCIQKEEEQKFDSYLSCFIGEGDFEGCLSEIQVDRVKMETCISATDAEFSITEKYNDKSTWLNGNYPQFDTHTDLNDKYGVRGSPTIVINDQVVTVNPRSPENFKKIICSAFNSPPQECSQVLSDEVPAPGLGWETGSSSGGSCG